MSSATALFALAMPLNSVLLVLILATKSKVRSFFIKCFCLKVLAGIFLSGRMELGY